METVVASFIVGVLFVALYSGATSGIRMLQISRENLRATQILVEKMEGIRLFNWDQISSNGFIPTEFTQSYYTSSSTNTPAAGSGIIYTGRVTITNVPFSTTYNSEMKFIQIDLTWPSTMNSTRKRSIQTFVSRYGLQNYIY